MYEDLAPDRKRIIEAFFQDITAMITDNGLSCVEVEILLGTLVSATFGPEDSQRFVQWCRVCAKCSEMPLEMTFEVAVRDVRDVH